MRPYIKRHAPKVRTGCVICKRRRIKCDEAKPQCLRCVKHGSHCYYEVPNTWVFEPKKHVQDAPEKRTRTSSTTGLYHELNWDILSSDDSHFLGLFVRRLGRVTAEYGHGRFDFWTRLVPQVASSVPAIKHILIASALSNEAWLRLTVPSSLERAIDHHYNLALREIAYGSPTPEVALMMCLAAFTFESINGRVELVKTHLLSAGRIVDDYHHKLSQYTIARSSLLFEAIEPIVFECQIYAGIIPPRGTPVDGIHTIQYWKTEPVTPPYVSIEDAGYELTAATRYLLEPAGQTTYAMIRASVFLSRWRKSFDKFRPQKDRYSKTLLCLHDLMKALLDVLQQTTDQDVSVSITLAICRMRGITELGAANLERVLIGASQLLAPRCSTSDQKEGVERVLDMFEP
ncbi:uncharacterized protein PV06_11419 [Exophiala oligosperma]|uniref:Zn(2)-C6 fungal-type domain-containing protein n=2 Tax=Chaetothyriales TaxID=34395 RepID=A0A0D2A7K5_9EURO|nr:uncharacterized protein PV06_11419 [Exophiala oligosperma]KAJ9611805.1 hypothetical protein H2204_015191 [Knufia peltigerae]KIW36321.1 hypothetical protein PV06_11419 [Exophiala oligosperma]